MPRLAQGGEDRAARGRAARARRLDDVEVPGRLAVRLGVPAASAAGRAAAGRSGRRARRAARLQRVEPRELRQAERGLQVGDAGSCSRARPVRSTRGPPAASPSRRVAGHAVRAQQRAADARAPSSCVVTMPPSAVVMILTAWKLNTVASARRCRPGCRRYAAPVACEASSRILKP